MRTQNWTVKIDNKIYNIEYSKMFYKKRLLVNKIPIKLQRSKTFGITRETPFKLGNKIAILVNIDRDSDIAIDGTFLNSREKYTNVKYMPHWNFIFLVLILLIFLFSYTTICSALYVLIGFYFLIRVSIEPTLNIHQRILLCLLITLLMHLFFWGVLFLLLSIL